MSANHTVMNQIRKLVKEELEVVLTNEEAIEMFDLDPAAMLDEMMTVSTDDLYLAEEFETSSYREEDDKDPKAKVRNRPDPVFPDDSDKVSDDKDHFPIDTKARGQNALSRASQYSSKPAWWEGTLQSLVSRVRSKVKEKYPSIKTSKASENPGKG
tara:strand:+ start:1277 stop:1744 length:468 start_codon:yes stop_codon:yes gene_type:complete